MWKTLVVLAFVASTFLVTPSEGTSGCKQPTTTSKPCSGNSGPSKPHHKCSKPSEVFDKCPAPCPPRECGVNKALILCAPAPKPGSADCKPGCRCIDGYVRNKVGNCIPENECPIKCPKNETLDPCLSSCPPRECGVNIAAVTCLAQDPDDCKPGCRCKDDYLRNSSGFCVLAEDCPKCPNPNEVFDKCPAPCPPRRCDVDERVIRCAAPPKPGDPECQPGCRCIDGYVRNYEGQCVTRDQCPKCTGTHEVFNNCPTTCPPQTCESIGKTYHCPKAPSKCPNGTCVCEQGYFRNILGECISKENCLKCNGTHEYFTCGGPCDNVCATLREKNQTNCPEDNIQCNSKCYCYPGYARDDDDKCIPFDECKVLVCGDNEIISECPEFECRPLECSQVGFPVNCPEDKTKCPGKAACVCNYGYARNCDGKCVPLNECPSCGGDRNATSGCGVNCGKHCYNLKDKEPVACIDICYENACDCKEGYRYDDNTKECVLPKDCTPVCGKDQVYSDCINGNCQPKNCSQLGFPIPCRKIDPASCIKGCLCKDGYVYAKNGTCIPKESCPSCGGDPNKVSGCGVNCGRHCSDKGKGPIACPAICNTNGCDCRKGLVVDDSTGKCIPPDQCAPVCGKDQVYSDCINGNCQPKNCSQLGFPIPCRKIDPASCIKGCLCKDGYVYAKNGTCIPKESCPSCGGDPNKVSGCGVNCGRHCSNKGKGPIACPAICNTNGCDCRKGLVVDDSTGKCIPPDQCVSCGGDYNAEPGCDKDGSRRCPGFTPDDCKCYKDTCRCKAGFLYDPKLGKCVRQESCSSPCGDFEVLSNCSNGGCGPWTCSDVGFPTGCVKMDPKYCKVGCICIEGYVKENETCIPATQCPSCGGDPNSKPGCGINCGRLCSNYNKGPVPCPKICKVNACDCKKEFVFDTNTGICVPPKNCTPTCGDDEDYSECINGGCQAKNCSQLGKPVPCIKIDPKYCIKGCLCKEGLFRADNGSCVPEDQCNPCKNPHEHYEKCASTCPPQTCESIGHKYNCPLAPEYCKGACRCDEGYYRNKRGECISEKNCLKCTKPNEYFSCGGACDNVCANLTVQNQTNCPIRNIKCNPMCYCEDGYARDNNSICIPIDQCPVSCGDDPNAKPGCGVNCGRLCSNYKNKNVVCPLICKVGGCDCKDGFVYDTILGKCVYPKDCTKVCGKNEVYNTCANGGCDKRNCSQLNQPAICIDPIKCIGGCVCQKGYLKADNGTCVPADQCPRICNQPHQIYDPCPPICPPQTCESIGKSYSCPAMIIGRNCTGACRCEKGYYRNKRGECISEEDCLKCTKPNEYFSCGGACDNVCANLTVQNQTNCPIRNIKCNPMCYCEDGYARDNNSICIPIDQCPVSCGDDPNAKPGCGVNCGRLCSNYKNKNVVCPLICKVGGCDCKDGFVYDTILGKCVYPKDCTKVCGKNEVYNTCANGGCDKRNCSQLNQPAICIDPIKCIGGCVCQKGYLKADNGTCVPADQCPLQCTQPHEVLDLCPLSCPPQTCDSIGKVYPCPKLPPDSSKYCKPACRCEDDYYRNVKGECISKKDCLKCTGPNEYFSCGVACDNECATLQIQNQTHCLIFNKKCNPKCYCYEGYARNSNNVCIPIEQCEACALQHVHRKHVRALTSVCLDICPIETVQEPPCKPSCICKDGHFRNNIGECITEDECSPRCGPNERYEENPSKVCDPLDCTEVGFPIDCPPVEDPDCEDTPACICKQGYVRDSCGVCIPISQCPSCGGDQNAVAGCGVNCGNHCSDYGQEVGCITVCYQNACDCRDGYVFDDIIGKCVHYEDCTPTNTTTPPSKVNATEALEQFNEGNIAFDGDFLYELVLSNPDKNCVASAISLLIALAQLALFSIGKVFEQLRSVLNIGKEQIKTVFPILINDFANQSNVDFSVAITCFANNEYPLSDKFITYSRDYLGANAQNVDFSKPVPAAKTINDWVSNHTNGRITDLVSPSLLSADTRLALLNAIYFKGTWKYQFNRNDTKTKNFTKSNGDIVPVEMMYQQNKFNYAENDEYQSLELIFVNSNFSFITILPKTGISLTAIAETMKDAKVFQDMISNFRIQQVKVHHPKFLIESDIDLSEILQKLNVTSIFNPNNNEIVGVLNNPEPLYVSAAIQKAFVEVNEEGSEAAAATAVVISTRSLPISPEPIYVFNANHPFLFYIAFEGTVLFCGAFVE